jgi:hypothetical protein
MRGCGSPASTVLRSISYVVPCFVYSTLAEIVFYFVFVCRVSYTAHGTKDGTLVKSSRNASTAVDAYKSGSTLRR